MKNKLLLTFLLIAIGIQGYSQQTDYYRWDKTYLKNGTTTKETANNGLFITRKGNVCYDSNREGNSVENGNLKLSYTNNDYAVYTGPCYYGNDCEYVFYDSEGILNIVQPNGTTYVFVRETPPAGRNTCSLIKKNEVTPIIPIENNSNNDVSNKHPKKKTRRVVDCSACGGKGSLKQNVATPSGYGVEVRYIYCNECGKSSSTPHRHINCKWCNGRGKRVIEE